MDFAEYLKNSAKALDKEIGKILEEQLRKADLDVILRGIT